MRKSDYLFLVGSFLIWRISLFIFLFLAMRLIPLGENFLGGRRINYELNPFLWSWVNFDGEHFLTIASKGYESLTYFFFPLYPLIVSLLGNIFGRNIHTLAFLGLAVSNLSFFLALVGFWKLIRLDFDRNVARLSTLLLLAFPTSFFFASFYSESLFLALAVWSFYFARKEKWFLSSLVGGLGTAARVVGIAIFASFVPEFLKRKKYIIFLMPLGLVLYMLYMYQSTGDAFGFISTVSIFGPQRSSEIILLPQVFYRYIFKILPNMGSNFIPAFEFLTASLFLFLAIISYKKLNLSYSLYLLLGYLIPTLSGSFSSLPRYVLVLFPGFILMALYLQKCSNILKFIIFSVLFVCLLISTMMFTRGIWIA